ncbi:MAG: hypothetical protein JW873_02885 [Candidatus Saganbacteria bacterium]|nr:hypothetical protein [Candidatus Saganbacteria bacterium]
MVNCPLCNQPAKQDKRGALHDTIIYECKVCGKYIITGTADTTVRDVAIKDKLHLISWQTKEQNERGKVPHLFDEDIQRIIKANYSPTATEKIDQYLIYMGRHTSQFGEVLAIDYEEYPIAYAKNRDELISIVQATTELGYVKEKTGKGFSLTVKGFDKLEKLKDTNVLSKHCFVAMSFGTEYDPIYNEAIQPALIATGFESIFLKTAEHNEWIDDAIMSGIKRSRFLISEFSSGNQGVYFETGFAMGLKIPVISICQEDKKGELHFDVEHYNTIFYRTTAELKERLIKRIEATIA